MTLTREEILTMEPGRELDALVADKVIGMDLVEDTLLQLPRYYLPEYDRTIHRDVPLYSSDISAAWEVVEKLRIAVTPQSISAPEELSYMAEYENAPYVELKRVFARTAPEAICKAALLAVLNL